MFHRPLDRRQVLSALPLTLGVLLAGARSAPAAVSADAAQELIENVGSEVLVVLRDPDLSRPGQA